jgi:hypothetical protein
MVCRFAVCLFVVLTDGRASTRVGGEPVDRRFTMANFVLLYHGGGMPETPEEGAKVMQAWTTWFAELGEALVDGGNPVSQVRTITADRSVGSGDGHTLTGYSIIKANDLDAAVALAKGCPVLDGGSSVDVAETFVAM